MVVASSRTTLAQGVVDDGAAGGPRLTHHRRGSLPGGHGIDACGRRSNEAGGGRSGRSGRRGRRRRPGREAAGGQRPPHAPSPGAEDPALGRRSTGGVDPAPRAQGPARWRGARWTQGPLHWPMGRRAERVLGVDRPGAHVGAATARRARLCARAPRPCAPPVRPARTSADSSCSPGRSAPPRSSAPSSTPSPSRPFVARAHGARYLSPTGAARRALPPWAVRRLAAARLGFGAPQRVASVRDRRGLRGSPRSGGVGAPPQESSPS